MADQPKPPEHDNPNVGELQLIQSTLHKLKERLESSGAEIPIGVQVILASIETKLKSSHVTLESIEALSRKTYQTNETLREAEERHKQVIQHRQQQHINVLKRERLALQGVMNGMLAVSKNQFKQRDTQVREMKDKLQQSLQEVNVTLAASKAKAELLESRIRSMETKHKHSLQELTSRLDASKTQLELQESRFRSMEKEYEQALEEHKLKLDNSVAEGNTQAEFHESQIRSMETEHKEFVQDQQGKHVEMIQNLQDSHNQELASLRKSQEEQIFSLGTSNDEKLSFLRASHQDEVSSVRASYEDQVSSLCSVNAENQASLIKATVEPYLAELRRLMEQSSYTSDKKWQDLLQKSRDEMSSVLSVQTQQINKKDTKIADMSERLIGANDELSKVRSKHELEFAEFRTAQQVLQDKLVSDSQDLEAHLQQAEESVADLTEQRQQLEQKSKSQTFNFFQQMEVRDAEFDKERKELQRDFVQTHGNIDLLRAEADELRTSATRDKHTIQKLKQSKQDAERRILELESLLVQTPAKTHDDLINSVRNLVKENATYRNTKEAELTQRLKLAESVKSTLMDASQASEQKYQAERQHDESVIRSLRERVAVLEDEVYTQVCMKDLAAQPSHDFDEEERLMAKLKEQQPARPTQRETQVPRNRRSSGPELHDPAEPLPSTQQSGELASQLQSTSPSWRDQDEFDATAKDAAQAEDFQELFLTRFDDRSRETSVASELPPGLTVSIEQSPNSRVNVSTVAKTLSSVARGKRRRDTPQDESARRDLAAMPPPSKRPRHGAKRPDSLMSGGAGPSSARRSSRNPAPRMPSYAESQAETPGARGSSSTSPMVLPKPPKDQTPASEKAAVIWSMIETPPDMSAADQKICKAWLFRAFDGYSKPDLDTVIERIDKYVVGDFTREPAQPRPCFLAAAMKRSAGPGGPEMNSGNCPFCTKNKDSSVCYWASFVNGVDTGFGPRVDGKIRGDDAEWDLNDGKITTIEKDGARVRWALTMRP